MRGVLCLLLVTFWGNFACGEDNYFPLGVGQQRVTTERVSRKGSSVDQDALATIHEIFVGTAKWRGRTYSICRHWKTWDSPRQKKLLKDLPAYLLFFRKDGNVLLHMEHGPLGTFEYVDYILPAKVGEQWQRKWGDRGLPHPIVTTRSAKSSVEQETFTNKGQETLKVSGKVYRNCYHLRITEGASRAIDVWFAPGVGRVKSIMVDLDLRFVNTLKKFKPGI
jgi:hypothetical protein